MYQNRRMNSVTVVTVALCCLLLPTLLLVQAQPQHPATAAAQRYSRSETALEPTGAGTGEHISGRRFKRMYAMCPPHFFRIGNECYFISPNKQNWLDAHFECKDRNSKLAEPMKYDDKNLRKFLISSKAKDFIWIGGNYNWRANKWQWGYNGKDIGYQSFSQMVPGSSQDLKYHCAVLNPDLRFRWSAKLCTEKLNFICQHKMPFVNSHSRTKVYSRWNATFPNELANEVEVVVADQPHSSRKNDYYSTSVNMTTVAPVVLYNRIRGMKQSNRTLRIRPSRRRPNRNKLLPKNDYISNDVYRRPVVEYVQDHNNYLNGNGNGNGNGYRNGFKPAGFNVDIHQRQRPSGHKKQQQHNARLNDVNGEYRPHQHRHQRPVTTAAPPATTTLPATTTTRPTTTTTPTTTTRAPEKLPTEAFQDTDTERTEYAHLSHDEKKARRARLRERLGRLTDEERELFYAERAKRKRTKKARTHNETIP